MTDCILRIRTEVLGPDVAVVTLSGELDIGSLPDLERVLDSLHRANRVIVIDIDDLRYLDSSGFRALHVAARSTVIVLVMQPKAVLARAVRVGGLAELIPIYDDLETAMAHVAPQKDDC